MRPQHFARTAVVVAILAGCSHTTTQDRPAVQGPDWFTERLGGDTTARELRGRPFNQSARSLTNPEVQRFFKGAETFDRFNTPEQGLGPLFVETGCISCHIDGEPPADATTDAGPGHLVRISLDTPAGAAPVAVPGYGTQLQTQAIGAEPEVDARISYTTSTFTYPDGSTAELRTPQLTFTRWAYGIPPERMNTSIRISPAIVGMGLLEAVPLDQIQRMADPEDTNGDGISGRLNQVTTGQGGTAMGRFGWKAGQASVHDQTVAALDGDMGITTADSHPDQTPELTPIELADQVFYNRTIAVPIARYKDHPNAAAGANLFASTGCSSCHTPEWTTGADEVRGLSNQVIHPFTDLLVHDMGEGLADGVSEFDASGAEWRTAPLWAIGRRAEVTGFSTYLHDGRARTLEEAILWHGGEALGARDRFAALTATQRAELLDFLAAL